MRVKTGKAVSRYLGAFIVLLLFLLRESFPNAAYAFTSLNACARSKECLELIKESSRSAVTAPTGAGFGGSTLSTTTSSGAVKTSVQGITDFVVKVGPTAVQVGWHYWSQTQNERVQNRARERYCTVYPSDVVCTPFTGGQSYGVPYKVTYSITNPQGVTSVATPSRGYYGPILGGIEKRDNSWGYSYGFFIRAGTGPNFKPSDTPYDFSIFGASGGSSSNWNYKSQIISVARADGLPDPSIDPPPLPWKDWSQAKRDAAVALLTDSEWQRFITSMPRGGTLDPGDTVKAPKILIPGQEWDNPNTLGDDRRLKTVPGEQARPVVPDFDHDSDPDETDADDDNDGVIEPYDPEPRNPYVPKASSEPPSPPEDDRTNQSEGERDVSQVRESYGDFLEKAENDAFENRLDAIEDKYRRAAAEQDEIERDWLTMEADDELQQLKNEIGEAWWSSLSQYERQLFEGRSQAEIDEMQMHMKQWDASTYDDVAHSILDHSSRKGYEDPLEFVRDVSNFEKSQAERIPEVGVSEKGTVRWEIRRTGEYIIETPDGKFVTYGFNPR